MLVGRVQNEVYVMLLNFCPTAGSGGAAAIVSVLPYKSACYKRLISILNRYHCVSLFLYQSCGEKNNNRANNFSQNCVIN